MKLIRDYYHALQTGRIFYYSCVSATRDANNFGDGVRDQFDFRVVAGAAMSLASG